MCKQSRKVFKTKLGKHILCEYSISTIWAFDHIENMHTLYRGRSCVKTFAVL